MSIVTEAFLEQMKQAAQEYPTEFQAIIKPFVPEKEERMKQMYTLVEICETLNIKYSTFYTRGLHSHPEILKLRKRYGRHYAYPAEAIDTIKILWEEGVGLQWK